MDFKQETARKIQRWHAEISQDCAPFQSKCAARDQKCSPRASILDTNLLKLNQQPVYYSSTGGRTRAGSVAPWCQCAKAGRGAIRPHVTSPPYSAQ